LHETYPGIEDGGSRLLLRRKVVYVLVYGAALVTTFLPALQASRVYPAEALRYE